MSKADRAKKKRRTAPSRAASHTGPQKQPNPIRRGGHPAETAKPTKERLAHGAWVIGKRDEPSVDLASDMIGALHCQRRITDAQLQAARAWQELRAEWLAEFPDIAGFKSCLHGSVPGYDDGEGNPAVMRAYRQMEQRLTLPQRRIMLLVCDQGQKPANIALLRQGLDALC